MTKSRKLTALGVLVMTGAVSLAACSSGTNSSAAKTGTSSSAKSATGTPSQTGSNPGSSFCNGLTNSQSESAQLATTMAQAVQSGNVSTAKQALDSVLTTIAQDLNTVESKMSSVPANVQAAITTVNNFFTQAKTAIANTTSLSQMGMAMAGLDTQQLKDASATLAGYAASQCGVTPSTTG
jgi:hypothetical protein